jgi:hypothetical protein
MPEHSDGIAEELDRQLQITLSTAAVIARRGLAQRQHTLEQAKRESEQAARAAREQIETDGDSRPRSCSRCSTRPGGRRQRRRRSLACGSTQTAGETPPVATSLSRPSIEPPTGSTMSSETGSGSTPPNCKLSPPSRNSRPIKTEPPNSVPGPRCRHPDSTPPTGASSCEPGWPPPACPRARSTPAPWPTSGRATSPPGPSLRPRTLRTDQGPGRPTPAAATVANSAWRGSRRSRLRRRSPVGPARRRRRFVQWRPQDR